MSVERLIGASDDALVYRCDVCGEVLEIPICVERFERKAFNRDVSAFRAAHADCDPAQPRLPGILT